MEFRRFFNILKEAVIKRYYLVKLRFSSPGASDWLIGTEMKYGGRVINLARNKVSPNDPRSKERLAAGGMIGGDRMYHHGYAKDYSYYLQPFIERNKPLTIVEVGILKGTGLAIWGDLFPKGKVIGLDIDLSYFKQNLIQLKKLGAFKKRIPMVYEYDSFGGNRYYLRKILKDRKIDVYIDDSYHSVNAIMQNLKSVSPYLSDRFVCFIEDNKIVYKQIRKKYPEWQVFNKGMLTVINNIHD